jgi:hypothetical protein
MAVTSAVTSACAEGLNVPELLRKKKKDEKNKKNRLFLPTPQVT